MPLERPTSMGLSPITCSTIARTPVIVVKSMRPLLRPLHDEMVGTGAISILVDKWFAENTFHAEEFADLRGTGRDQARQGIDGQPGAAGAQRGGDRRQGHLHHQAGADGRRSPARRDRADRLRLHRPHARDCGRAGRAGAHSPADSAGVWRAARQGRGALEEPARDHAATSSPGSTPTSSISTRALSTASSGR